MWVYIFWTLSVLVDDIQDTIYHHYERSIFKGWEFMRHDWRRKYVNGNPSDGRKIFLQPVGFPTIYCTWLQRILQIPPALFDGWHFFKLWRLGFLVAAIFSYTGHHPLIVFSVCSLIFSVVHPLFYGKLLTSVEDPYP